MRRPMSLGSGERMGSAVPPVMVVGPLKLFVVRMVRVPELVLVRLVPEPLRLPLPLNV